MKTNLVPSILAALAAAFALASCGGGDGSGTDPAAVAPPQAPLFLEATLQPDAETGEAIESLAQRIAGVDDLGELIVSELEDGAGDPIDFETEIEPWLGEQAGLFLNSYDGDDFEGYGIAVQTTDADAAWEFVQDNVEERGKPPAEDATYEDVEFKIEDDGTAVGVVDGLVVLAEDKAVFEEAVDASGGESLADSDVYADAIGTAPSDSFADLYVDVGGLIEESGGAIDPETETILKGAGIEPGEATAVASVIPGSEQIEVDFTTDATGDNPTSGDPSALLEALPADAVAAYATPEFGVRLDELVERIDENGLGEDVPPGEFRSGLRQAGIDLEAIAGSVGDMALFLETGRGGDPAGALVMETTGSEAKEAIGNIGKLLRAAGVEGVSAVDEGFSGFSVRSSDLGDKPLVVATKGERIAIAYGLPAATKALNAEGPTLGESAEFKAAAGVLGDTPIAAYLDGPAVVRLIDSLVDPGEEEWEEAKPFAEAIEYAALGSGAEGDRSTAKLIIGIGK
jgi:hypothetical protein